VGMGGKKNEGPTVSIANVKGNNKTRESGERDSGRKGPVFPDPKEGNGHREMIPGKAGLRLRGGGGKTKNLTRGTSPRGKNGADRAIFKKGKVKRDQWGFKCQKIEQAETKDDGG